MSDPVPEYVGALPDYIPPHLNGKVMDFRNEPGGNISFLHPEGAAGLSPELSRVTLDEDSYKRTFDRQHRLANFQDSIKNQYALRREVPPGKQINSWIAGKLRGAYDWGTSTQGKAVGASALLSMLAGGLGGFMLGNYSGSGSKRKALLGAILGGALGTGASLWAQNKHNRREAYLRKQSSTAIDQVLIRALDNDPTLNGYERSMLLRALTRVSTPQRSELYGLIRTTIGAGAGMLVMRFLAGKGLIPALAGGILGGLIGRPSSPELEYNGMGQLSMTNYL